MAGNSSASDDETISGINVTPLVDVVLVLLIIFLVTAPVIYQSAIKVQLPKAQTAEAQQKTPLNFTVSKDGTLHWGKDQLTWEEFGHRLAALGPEASNQTALISADEGVPYGAVARLMDTLRQAGLVHFALSVEAPTAK